MLRLIVLLAALLSAAPAVAAETRLTFLHFNDVYEFLPDGDSGGLAGLQTLIERQTQDHPQAVLTFGGDLISPSMASGLTQGAHMIDLLNAMAPAAAVLGNHEFDFGAPVLRSRMAESRFPWLVTNVSEPDGAPFAQARRWLLIERNGVRIGLFGVLTVGSASLSAGGRDARFAEELATARDAVRHLRDQGAQVVVALTHQDVTRDLAMARQVAGIDLILGGHDHEAMAVMAGKVPVLKAGANGEYLAAIDLVVADGKVRPADMRLLPSRGQPASATLAPLVQRHATIVDGALGQPLAVLEAPLDSRQALARAGRSSFGVLVAEALRHATGAEIALVNGGNLRGDRQYPAGSPISRADLMRELPFANSVLVLEIDGATLLAALEHGVSKAPALSGRFPQVAGLDFTYDTGAEAGRRIGRALVGDAPLDPGRRYRLATNSYLAEGGDGYAMLKHAKRLVDAEAAPLLVNVVAEHLSRKKSP